MKKILGIDINKIEKKSDKVIILFFLISVVFLYKTYLLVSLLPLYLIIKNKILKSSDLLEFIGKIGLLKFIGSFILTYSNMQNESIRLMLISITLLYLYSNKKIKFGDKQIMICLFLWLFGGIFWNFVSPGGIESAKFFYETNKLIIALFCIINIMETDKIVKYLSVYTIYRYLYIVIKLPNDGLRSMYSSITTSIIPIVSVYLFYCFLVEKKKLLKTIYIVSTLTGIYLLGLTTSRGATLSIIIILVLMLIIKYKKKSIKYLLFFILLIFLFLSKSERFEKKISNLNDRSNLGRIELYKASFYAFKESPIVGVGRGNTLIYFNKYMDKVKEKYNLIEDKESKKALKLKQTLSYDRMIRNFPDSHNIIIDFITENGLLGLLMIYILFILIPYKLIIWAKKFDTEDYLLLLCFLLVFNLVGLTWSIWTRHTQGIKYFYLFLGLILCRRENEIKCNSTSI